MGSQNIDLTIITQTQTIAMSVSYKITLIGENNHRETRRMIVGEENSNLASLKEKLMNIFSSLKPHNYVLQWTDDEGDDITITSEEDLTVAMTDMKGPVYKLLIKTKLDEKEKEKSCLAAITHPGIICDGCDEAVAGYRYKCMTCPDYDLCGLCERKGKHSMHPMLRIARPGPYMSHNRQRTQGCSKKINTEDTNEDKVDIHGEKKKEVDLAKMTPAPTIEGLIKDFVQAKEANSRPKADNQDKETIDQIEQAANFLDMNPENLKQISNLLEKFGVEFKFENMLDDLGGKSNTEVHQNQEDAEKPDSTNSNDIKNGNNEKEDEWRLIENEGENNKQFVSKINAPGNNDGNNDIGTENLNEHIEKAFNEMKKMGFTNDGEWLIKLLQAKSGDIAQTMQALKLD